MSYQFNSVVNRQEAEALKDMIFKRAKERAQAMSEDVQSDVMDLARDSFVSDNNPFSKIANPAPVIQQTVEEKPVSDDSENGEIGFAMPKRPVMVQSQTANDSIVKATVENTMMDARKELAKKDSFMGALNFLNSQAAVSLIRTRADRFEILV